jgi:uncharacterized membrane protein SpoIIM required for sporulation
MAHEALTHALAFAGGFIVGLFTLAVYAFNHIKRD